MNASSTKTIVIGFIVNPMAGVGGPAGNKGSDDIAIQNRARRGEIALRAPARAEQFLAQLTALLASSIPDIPAFEFLVAPSTMGEAYCASMCFSYRVTDIALQRITNAHDTQTQARFMLDKKIDLLIFVGGDGTARDICRAVGMEVPVLGIPSGVKMHSGVFAIAPEPAADIVAKLLLADLITVSKQEVRDIDECAFREGRVRSQHFGEMLVPSENHFVQQVKQGGLEVEELVLMDMAAEIRERIELLGKPTRIIFGPGSTTQFIQQEFALPSTLLGVDVVRYCPDNGFSSEQEDVSASELEQLVDDNNTVVRLVVTAIGGQGHVFGRGNQQLSPAVLRRVGKENTWVVATKTKLENLKRRPLLMDSGDPVLDAEWSGFVSVLCGFQDSVLYPFGWQYNLSNDKQSSTMTNETTVLLQKIIDECQKNIAGVRETGDSKRLFHGRGGRWPGLEYCVIDYIRPCLLVTLFRQPPEGFVSALLECLEKIVFSQDATLTCLLVQCRYLEASPITSEVGELPQAWNAKRKNLTFGLSATQQNIGFFLDIEPVREWLEKNCKQKTVLNLFAYTCAFSVVAMAAGAKAVTNIDMSSRSLSIGRDSHRANNLDVRAVTFLPHNIFKSWGKLRKNGPYDIVIVDPPSFQKGSFVAQKDYAKVLRKMASLVSDNGVFLACLNAPEVAASEFKQLINAECEEFVFTERLESKPEFLDCDPEKSLKMMVYRRKDSES
ncbi:class I SAM-dependent methyltransferase [Teredinibacter purpureus]|uniref:class I SAM-dependent methyltransferase n=1 Tax=Teredinibacter purpureus TaxID=2731756 RepID=UPI0005F80BA4|nr:class I SAM-dependent methyltransferase [Teredinibacter purpureus]